MCAKSLSHVWFFVTPWTVARQAPLSMGFSRQNARVSCHSLLPDYSFLTWTVFWAKANLGGACRMSWGFASGSVVKNLPAMQELPEMQVWSLGQEDPLEEELATHCSTLAWENIHGQRSLVGCSPRSPKSDTTQWLNHHPTQWLNHHPTQIASLSHTKLVSLL